MHLVIFTKNIPKSLYTDEKTWHTGERHRSSRSLEAMVSGDSPYATHRWRVVQGKKWQCSHFPDAFPSHLPYVGTAFCPLRWYPGSGISS